MCCRTSEVRGIPSAAGWTPMAAEPSREQVQLAATELIESGARNDP